MNAFSIKEKTIKILNVYTVYLFPLSLMSPLIKDSLDSLSTITLNTSHFLYFKDMRKSTDRRNVRDFQGFSK